MTDGSLVGRTNISVVELLTGLDKATGALRSTTRSILKSQTFVIELVVFTETNWASKQVRLLDDDLCLLPFCAFV